MLALLLDGASFIGMLLGIPAAVERWEARRQGRADQAAADTTATLKTVEAERQAVVTAKGESTEESLSDGTF